MNGGVEGIKVTGVFVVKKKKEVENEQQLFGGKSLAIFGWLAPKTGSR